MSRRKRELDTMVERYQHSYNPTAKSFFDDLESMTPIEAAYFGMALCEASGNRGNVADLLADLEDEV